MSVAVGPSGENHVYLNQLDQFLLHAASPGVLENFDDTFVLADMVNALRDKFQLEFLFGCGSNQHNQLALQSENNAADLVNGDEALEMKEIYLCMEKMGTENGDADMVKKVFAGGGHSGLLTKKGKLFLFGWNQNGQLGSSFISSSQIDDSKLYTFTVASELKSFIIEDASLGHSHTLVIEKDTGKVFAFGDNSRGQVDGAICSETIADPVTPSILEDTPVSCVAAGLFHSAAVTSTGELVTFGCGRFGQSPTAAFSSSSGSQEVWCGRWKPADGSKIVRVSCGRRHTVAVDENGNLWSFGDNKYGQLGRSIENEAGRDALAGRVETPTDVKFFDAYCGWSHTIALAKDAGGKVVAFGWGRNDKGQLGIGESMPAPLPIQLFSNIEIESVACGSESTVVVDSLNHIWCCGWNEHGNLGIGSKEDQLELTQVRGAPILKAPRYPETSKLCVAAGGAHVLAMKVI